MVGQPVVAKLLLKGKLRTCLTFLPCLSSRMALSVVVALARVVVRAVLVVSGRRKLLFASVVLVLRTRKKMR